MERLIHNSVFVSLLEWTDTHGRNERYAVLWLNWDHVVFYSYRTKMKYSLQCCCPGFCCVSYISCTLTENQIDYWHTMVSLMLRCKNNANALKESPRDNSKSCSCGMQKHEDDPAYLNQVKGSLRQEMHAKYLTVFSLKCQRACTQHYIHAHTHISLTGHSCCRLTHTGCTKHGTKQTAWYEMVWPPEAHKQQQPRARKMTGRSAFLLYEEAAAGTCQGQSPRVSISKWSTSLCCLPVPITLWWKQDAVVMDTTSLECLSLMHRGVCGPC